MIEIDFRHALSSAIGYRHGLTQRAMERHFRKHQPALARMMRSQGKPGYAFLALPDDRRLVAQVKRFAKKQKELNWKSIVVLGMGGSALGTLALQEALLNPFAPGPRLFVVDNVDPTAFARLMEHLELPRTLFLVVSKSGTTVEPMALYGIVRDALEKESPQGWRKQLVFITDPKEGLLRTLAKKEGIETFPIPPKVGGRFSVLSSAGLLPAALAGVDIAQLMKGAAAMREKIRSLKGEENPALLLAALQHLLDRKGKAITVMMPYSSLLFRTGDWYRQLLAESLGKSRKVGPTPIAGLGATDQHSQVQLYMEGPNNKWIIFLQVEQPEKDLAGGSQLPKGLDYLKGISLGRIMEALHSGTSRALAEAKRPSITLRLERLDALHLGALIMMLECQVALLGECYGVNAFDQPGVERGKALAKQALMEPEETLNPKK